MNNIIEQVDLKFTSGNSVPVERAVVKADEWEQIKEYVTQLESENKALKGLREDDIVSFNNRIAELENQIAIVARDVWNGTIEGLQDTRNEMVSLKKALQNAPHPPRQDSYEDFQKFHEEYRTWWQTRFVIKKQGV